MILTDEIIDGLEGGSAIADFSYTYTKSATNLILPAVSQVNNAVKTSSTIFNIAKAAIPKVVEIAETHSEESIVKRQLQANMQAQLSSPSSRQNATISSCCSYFVSDLQKSINGQKTSDAGYNADGTLNFRGRLMQNKTWNNFANNLALPIIGAAVGEGTGRLIFEGGALLFEASASGGSTVEKVGKLAKSWLGEDATNITNKAGDEIFVSKDGLRKMRFDIKNSQGDLPHVHLEKFVNGKWRDAIKGIHRIYPKQ